MSASSRIERYLRDHPDGDLLIAVGYAMAPGMAWLARHTSGRRVSLLIGDTRSQWWKKMSESDRAACLVFIRRGDVEIRNWYRTKRSRSGESAAHLKVWAVHDNWSPVSVLAGSGNLTRKGLDDNVEVMVEAHGNDVRQAWDTVRDLWGKAWPCADRLAEYLGGPESPAGPPRHRASASARSSATATPRHTTGGDYARRTPLPRAPERQPTTRARRPGRESPRCDAANGSSCTRSPDGSLCLGSPQAGRAASSESSGCSSSPGSSSYGPEDPRTSRLNLTGYCAGCVKPGEVLRRTLAPHRTTPPRSRRGSPTPSTQLARRPGPNRLTSDPLTGTHKWSPSTGARQRKR